MPITTSLKRNTDNEVLPQGYSTELNDWKEVVVNEDGLQKVEVNGNIYVSDLSSLFRENIEAINISQMLKASWYMNGTEYLDWVESEENTYGTIEKNADHLYFQVERDRATNSRQYLETTEPVNLTNIDQLSIELESERVGNFGSRVKISLLNPNDRSEVKVLESTTSNNIERQTRDYAVSDLEGKFIIQVGAKSETYDAGQITKYYRVWGERGVE